jgi:hypothetical protein
VPLFISKAVKKTKRLKSKVKGAHRINGVSSLSMQKTEALSAALVTALNKFKRRISIEDITRAWNSGDPATIDKQIPWDKLHEDLVPFYNILNSSMIKASYMALHELPEKVQKARINFSQADMFKLLHLPKPKNNDLRWDKANPKIRNYVANKTGGLIQSITHEVRAVVRRMVTRSFTHATVPRIAAKKIVGSIGLHERYQNAVNNYREQLEGTGKSDMFIDEQVSKYENRLLKSRSKTVAKTEMRQATNHGQRSIWREAASQGYIDKTKSKRVWVVAGAPCEICEPMDGQETTLDDSYTTADGDSVEPGDVHPNCECSEILEME